MSSAPDPLALELGLQGDVLEVPVRLTRVGLQRRAHVGLPEAHPVAEDEGVTRQRQHLPSRARDVTAGGCVPDEAATMRWPAHATSMTWKRGASWRSMLEKKSGKRHRWQGRGSGLGNTPGAVGGVPTRKFR